jgi:hypothetical protein
MKHSVLVIAALFSLVAISCKKETKSDNGEEPKQVYAVQFDVNDFGQSMGDFEGRKIADGNAPVSRDSLQKYIKFLYYIIYKNGDDVVKRIIQSASDPNFGSMTDSLPQGRYTLSIVGTTDSIRAIDHDPYDPYEEMWNNAISFGYDSDAFYTKLAINVDGELREKVSLSRVLAMISINIKDKIPYSATTMTIEPLLNPDDIWYFRGIPRFLNMPTGTYFHGDRNGTPVYRISERPIPQALRNTTNNTFNYTMLVFDTMTINLDFAVKDNNGIVLGSQKVLNIPVKRNRKITLSGNLFEALAADSGASIIVNPAWDAYGNSAEF